MHPLLTKGQFPHCPLAIKGRPLRLVEEVRYREGPSSAYLTDGRFTYRWDGIYEYLGRMPREVDLVSPDRDTNWEVQCILHKVECWSKTNFAIRGSPLGGAVIVPHRQVGGCLRLLRRYGFRVTVMGKFSYLVTRRHP